MTGQEQSDARWKVAETAAIKMEGGVGSARGVKGTVARVRLQMEEITELI